MSPPVLGRSSLIGIGVLGLLAGVLVAHQMTSAAAAEVPPPQVAAPPAPGPTAVATDGKPGIQFLDSRTPNAAGAPTATTASSSSGSSLRVMLMVAFLVGAPVVWYLTRKRQVAGKAGPGKSLTLLGSLKVAGRWQVALVKVPGKTLVLGATDKGLSLLTEVDDDALDDDRSDDLAAHVRPDDTVSLSSRAPHSRVATDPLLGSTRPRTDRPMTRPESTSSEPFGRLLDQLSRSGPSSPVRERPKTDEAVALRARLERHQPPH